MRSDKIDGILKKYDNVDEETKKKDLDNAHLFLFMLDQHLTDAIFDGSNVYLATNDGKFIHMEAFQLKKKEENDEK